MKKETWEKLQKWGLVRKEFGWDRYQEGKLKSKERKKKLKEKIEKIKAEEERKRPEKLRKTARRLVICFFFCFFVGLIFPPLLVLAFLCLIGLLMAVIMKYLG